MPRKPVEPVPALTSTLALLALVAGDEMFAAAIPLLRERMALSPAKLAVLLELTLNPHAFIKKKDEPLVRGIHEETLRDYKEQGFFPEFIGAEVLPSATQSIPKRSPNLPHL